MRRSLEYAPALLILFVAHLAARSEANEPGPSSARSDPASIERFEKEVRPILATRCQQCHGETKQKGGLRLDSRDSLLTGGNSGPAIVPGNPGDSLLVDAINHGELFQMPPKSKLPPKEIETLTTWVKDGARWGYEGTTPKPASKTADSKRKDNGPSDVVTQRKGFWSFQPVKAVAPPSAPPDHEAWPRNGVDRFILDAMRRHGLQPAPEADRRVLIRRLTFDLTGVPPTPAEIDAFLADPSPAAYETLVERLLSSPRYGERWGRHWLDLARYADTAGHEFDFETLNAYRYRDYVIRALNADLPYDQFVTEQVAGDLLESPRRRPGSGLNESILGTGFFCLGEGTHSPVDIREEEVRRVDNQIDVFSKTFLGLTVACARCHDHKFDPITARDYYALSGYMKSSRYQQAFLDPPDRNAPVMRRISESKEAVRSLLLEAVPSLPAKLGTELIAALTLKADDPGSASASAETSAEPNPKAGGTVVFESFNGPGFDSWQATGDAFGPGPSRGGEVVLESSSNPAGPSDWQIRPVRSGHAHSGLVANGFEGVLRSRSFTIRHRYVHMLASGRHGRINIVVDRFDKIRDPIYGRLTMSVNLKEPVKQEWITRDVSMWAGQSAYFELADGSSVDYNAGHTQKNPGDGYLSVDEIVLSDDAKPPARTADPVPPTPIPLAPVLAALDRDHSPLMGPLNAALAEYRSAVSEIPEPAFGLAVIDGTREDERLLIRGNHKNPGEPVPRRLLEVLGGREAPSPAAGSGRLELARQLVDPGNPLVARVMVNRIWQHHFGTGLVKSVDDFGAMGRKPSHPELLDWLAGQFVGRGWSIKSMHRLMVTSSTYRMKSTLDPEAERIDPTNTYLHRMNVRRLEGEAIRDALFAIAGGLNETMFGASVPVHLTSFLEGRGRPVKSGPLDGDRRRSIYLAVRRNFLNPMFLAFDTPAPFSTMGRRNVSNVPAQALTLLNDPLILTESREWAERVLDEPGLGTSERIERLYNEAFGRPPTPAEAAAGLSFLNRSEEDAAAGPAADRAERTRRAWADLCHVLINVKEFIYVE
jgi:hypothetical protein